MKLDEKELIKECTTLGNQAADISVQVTCLQESRRVILDKLAKAKQRLQAIVEQKPITVTDHALVRYAERHNNLDTDSIREELITPELQRMVDTLGGNGTFPIGNATVVLKNYNIVTYIQD